MIDECREGSAQMNFIAKNENMKFGILLLGTKDIIHNSVLQMISIYN